MSEIEAYNWGADTEFNSLEGPLAFCAVGYRSSRDFSYASEQGEASDGGGRLLH